MYQGKQFYKVDKYTYKESFPDYKVSLFFKEEFCQAVAAWSPWGAHWWARSRLDPLM